MFEADCCNGIVAVAGVMMPFCGESSGAGDIDGKDDVEGSEAAMGTVGALSASAADDCVSNSGGGTYGARKAHEGQLS